MKLGETGQEGGAFVLNDVVKCGKYCHTDTDKGRNYNVINQVLEGANVIGSGRLIVLDSAYVTTVLFKDAKSKWNLRMIGTLRSSTAHLPSNFSAIKSRATRWIRGYSETLHHECLNITFWNDSNAVAFFDNDLVSGRATWEQIETQTGPTKPKTFSPKAVATYRRNYDEIDPSNQTGSYYKIDRKTVRKQNRVLFDAIETYAPVNQHTICINCTNLTENKGKHELSAREFRFDLVRVWFAKCRSATGTISIHYPFKSSAHTQGVTAIIHSPRKGTHRSVKIDPEKTKKQLRCRECSSHTSFKCSKCGSIGRPVPLFRRSPGRNCWDIFQNRRVFDLPSSSQSIGQSSSQGNSQN